MAEAVGFEPTCPCGQLHFECSSLQPLRYASVYKYSLLGTNHMISSQGRYDHFDTCPYNFLCFHTAFILYMTLSILSSPFSNFSEAKMIKSLCNFPFPDGLGRAKTCKRQLIVLPGRRFAPVWYRAAYLYAKELAAVAASSLHQP